MKFLFKLLPTQLKIWLYTLLYNDIASNGEHEDTELAHINAFEKNLLKKVGGAGKRNPRTGLPGFLVAVVQLPHQLLLLIHQRQRHKLLEKLLK